MSNLVPKPIVDKNGKQTTVNVKPEAPKGVRLVGVGAPAAPAIPKATPLTQAGAEVLATIDTRGASFVGNGFNEKTVNTDGTFDGSDKPASDKGSWVVREGNFSLNQKAIEKFVAAGLVEVVPNDWSAELRLTAEGRHSVQEAAYDMADQGINDWSDLYAAVAVGNPTNHKSAIYEGGENVLA